MASLTPNSATEVSSSPRKRGASRPDGRFSGGAGNPGECINPDGDQTSPRACTGTGNRYCLDRTFIAPHLEPPKRSTLLSPLTSLTCSPPSCGAGDARRLRRTQPRDALQQQQERLELSLGLHSPPEQPELDDDDQLLISESRRPRTSVAPSLLHANQHLAAASALIPTGKDSVERRQYL
ncbi:hypothetical protein V8E36_003895 [Tilletia maclaganii]